MGKAITVNVSKYDISPSKFHKTALFPEHVMLKINNHVSISHCSADQPGRVWDHYEVSPKMSPYLVAFIVAHSDFMPTNNTMVTYLNKTSPEFRIYARQQLLATAEYASSIGPRVLEFYGDYFGIPYPLPNLHMAAIPDFAAGAMENWGLLTYR
jgi:aminopeptidase N